jgi:predicted transcriptional regulator
MNRKALAITVCSLLFLALSGPSLPGNEKVGKKAPSFRVESGDGKVLTPNKLRGKVLVIFYETREVVEKNRELKKALNELARDPSFPSDVSLGVPIVNCSGAFWPFARIWRSKLKENSKKEGLTIYGDWDGKMFTDYKMKNHESNVLAIDKNGMIRYSKAGKIDSKGINEIVDLLRKLASENKRPRRTEEKASGNLR